MYHVHAAEDERTDVTGREVKWIEMVVGPRFHKFWPAESWQPSVNLYEDDAHYFVVVDVAGVTVSDLDVKVEKGLLTVTGQRAVPQPEDPQGPLRLHVMEIDHGRFTRTVHLPQDVDVGEIDARYRCGLLWIRMPKQQQGGA